MSDDSDIYFILEVDLKYPNTLHEEHNEYPLTPEQMTITDVMLSPYSRDLKLGLKALPPGNSLQIYVIK